MSVFEKFAFQSDMYIPCHFWSSKSPLILPREVLVSPENRIKVVGDISCDVDGSVPITWKATSIKDPVIGWSRSKQQPCELQIDFNRILGGALRLKQCLLGLRNSIHYLIDLGYRHPFLRILNLTVLERLDRLLNLVGLLG